MIAYSNTPFQLHVLFSKEVNISFTYICEQIKPRLRGFICSFIIYYYCGLFWLLLVFVRADISYSTAWNSKAIEVSAIS
jgi:hypothetical protein